MPYIRFLSLHEGSKINQVVNDQKKSFFDSFGVTMESKVTNGACSF